MKVYILTFNNYDYRAIVGVYADKKTAVLHAKQKARELYPQYNFYWHRDDYICKEGLAEWSIQDWAIQA